MTGIDSRYMPYPKYQPSGIDWIGNIPAHWGVEVLSKIAIENKEKNKHNQESYVLSLSYGKIINRDTSDNFGLLPESFDTYQIVKVGYIILRLTDLQNDKRSLRVGLVKKRGIITSAYIGLIIGKGYHTYVYYLLHSYDILKIFYKFGGGVRQSMKFAELKNLPILFPPLNEQQAITTFLDREIAKIDTLIEKKQRLLDLLAERRQALISHVVTKGLNPDMPMKPSGVEWIGDIPKAWGLARLDSLCKVKARLGWRGLKASEYVDNGYIFLATPNIKGEIIDFVNVNYITSERYFESPEIMLEENNVLIVKDGSTLGIVSVVKNLPHEATVNSSIAVVKIKKRLNSGYLHRYLAGGYIQAVIQQLKGGMGVPHLFQSDIKKFNILVPPLREQQAIADYLDEKTAKIDCLMQKVEQAIELLKERRTALISEAVTGKINVSDGVQSYDISNLTA